MTTVAKRLYFDLPGFGVVHAVNGQFTPAGDVATKEKSDLGPAGDSEEWMPGKLQFTIKNRPDISIDALRKLRNAEVTVRDDGGKTWFCTGCSTTAMPTLSGGDISMEMDFENQEEVR